MINWNKRDRDLTEIFDAKWKANHNDDVKKAREREKNFMDRLFDVKSNDNKIERPEVKSSREIQLDRLDKNMSNLRNNINNNFRNNINNKFR